MKLKNRMKVKLKEATVLSLKPTDVVVVNIPEYATDDFSAGMMNLCQKVFPKGTQVMLLPNDVTINVISEDKLNKGEVK